MRWLQGKHAKWPAELRHMRVEPGEGVPSLAEMLRGAYAERMCPFL